MNTKDAGCHGSLATFDDDCDQAKRMRERLHHGDLHVDGDAVHLEQPAATVTMQRLLGHPSTIFKVLLPSEGRRRTADQLDL